MEQEDWLRGGMVISILVLVVLILITPSLLGRSPSELASVPLLIIGMSKNESWFIVNIEAAFQAYRYDLVRMTINGTGQSVNWSHSEAEVFGFHRWVPGNASFSVHVYLVDQGKNYFEFNVSAHREKETNNRSVMVITFPFEKDFRGMDIRKYPDLKEDFRQGIPRRGSLP
jgi:hypothetical protein